MSLLTVKLARDLKATWPRVLMMVIAIAVSLTVFSSMLYAQTTAAREIRGAYADTEPASATIVLDRPVTAERMAALAAEAREQPGVIAAAGRTQFNSEEVRVNGQARDVPIQVFAAAPDDPRELARFDVQDGRWPPRPDEILIGGDSLTLLDVAVGDTVSVQTPSGDSLSLRVAGVVYDPSLAPAVQEQRGHAYVSTAALVTVGEPVFDQLKLQVADTGETTPSRDREAITTVAAEVGESMRGQGLAVREVQVPEPYKHPHQGQADALLGALLVGGAAALLLSTILVANMLNGLFTQQIPEIGIMKAIGARTSRVARLYLTLTLLVALVATLLALLPGILIGRAFVPVVFDFLNIEPVSLAPPWWTYALVLTAGLVLPPLMALVPLVKTSRTTVRAAIDHRGLGGESRTATRLLAFLGRVPRLDRGLVMALRNTVRRPARFLLSVGLLASAGVLFVAGMSTRDGLVAVAEESKAKRTWDVEVRLATPRPVDELAAIVTGASGVVRVEGWARAETGVADAGEIPTTRTYPDQGHGSVALTAIPDDTEMQTVPKLRDGRWLRPGETGAIVLNQIARKNTVPDIRAGETVQLSVGGRPTTWRVVGIAEERGGDAGAYVTAAGLAKATRRPAQVNLLRVATQSHDEQTRSAVAKNVAKLLTSASVEVREAASVTASEELTEGHLEPIVLILLMVALSMGVVGAIGLASTMSTNILERTREFGIMHAIGARPKSVRRIVVAEGVFIAIASCLVAVIPTLALTKVMGAGLGNIFMSVALPFRISLVAAAIWLVLVIVGAVLATEAAASRASRLTVREALSYL